MKDIKEIPRQYMEVPLSEINIDMSLNPRPGFKDLENFSRIVGLQGIHTPVALRKNSNGKFEILDGFRRCYAAKVNNFAIVPAYVYDCSEEEGKLIAALLNYYRKTQGVIAIGSHIHEAIVSKMKKDGYDPSDTEIVNQVIDQYYSWAAKSMGISYDEIQKLIRSYLAHSTDIQVLQEYKKLPDKYVPNITVSEKVAAIARKYNLDAIELAKIFKQENVTSGVATRILEDRDFFPHEAFENEKAFHKELKKKKGELKKFTESIRRDVIDHIEEYAENNEIPRSVATEQLIELGYDTWKR